MNKLFVWVFIACISIVPLSAFAATWQDAERICLRQCPPMPRYSGIETDAQYKKRMQQQAEHDRCFMQCARKTSSAYAPNFVPIGTVEQRYFKRNAE